MLISCEIAQFLPEYFQYRRHLPTYSTSRPMIHLCCSTLPCTELKPFSLQDCTINSNSNLNEAIQDGSEHGKLARFRSSLHYSFLLTI